MKRIFVITGLVWVNYLWGYIGCGFLTIGPGARPVALASSYVAVAEDAYATYYNPGALSFLRRPSIYLTRGNWLDGFHPDMYYHFLGFNLPISQKDALGLSLTHFSFGESLVLESL